jgi:hypothetical protein
MPGKLYQGQGEVVTPHLGDTQIHAMYLGSTYVGYDSRYSTFISASGGTIYDSGSYRYHLFTSSSDFTVHSLPLSQLNSRMEILVVGAGGGGSPGGTVGDPGAGNGGAVVHIPDSANYRLDIGTYNVSIGVGGIAGVDGVPTDTLPTSGSRSFVSGSGVEITALGGASPKNTFISQSSLPGVSGQYGHNFPNGQSSSQGSFGGGGAGQIGGDSPLTGCNGGGIGGDGYQVDTFPFSTNNPDITPTDFWGAGGGGTGYPCLPGCPCPGYATKPGGNGGGGNGGDNVLQPTAKNGRPNTGGGGGANVGFTAAGAGGSGYVGFRYRIA